MQKAIFAALALTALGTVAPAQLGPASGADRAGNRLFPFPAWTRERADPFTLHCTADHRWCARLRRGAAGAGWRLELSNGAAAPQSLEIAAPENETTTLSIWPHIVIERDGAAILGVERVDEGANPQGEWRFVRLVLVRAAPGRASLRQVLEVPTFAYNGLYACLHPGDRRRRFGACINKALYTGTLTLDPGTGAGPPHFLFVALARTWPAHGVLERELDRQIPLRRSDVRWAVDRECSYRFRVAWNGAQGVYMPDGQFPRCPDYFGF
ncbi:MAG: hypothetical protein JO276_14685 [Sphingomonadaceae bacterium]|nr:hypothetical protein [Sphingomonadaceae bacterium]